MLNGWYFIIVIVMLAGLVQGLTSFGFALVSVPLLATFLFVQEITPLVVILSLVTNLSVLSQCYRFVKFSSIWILILASLIAAPLGVLALKMVDASTLKLAVGAIVLLVSIVMFTGKTWPIRAERLALIPVGALSGFLNGSISMSGPPVALFLTNQRSSRDEFRANITAYALVLNVYTIVVFAATGILTNRVVSLAGWSLVPVIIGVGFGNALANRVNQQLFRQICLILIAASGVATIISVLG